MQRHKPSHDSLAFLKTSSISLIGEVGEKMQSALHEGLEQLQQGHDRSVSPDELQEKSLYNWYLAAAEAVKRGLVAQVI